MEISRKTIIHEVGHWITAALSGYPRYGIYFVEAGGGAVHGSGKSMESDMGGLLAVVELCPETLDQHLRTAFSDSVIISDDHPHRDLLSAEDIAWMDGADYDFYLIGREADRRNWVAPERFVLLRRVEARVRGAIRLNRPVMLLLVDLIQEWTAAQAEWDHNYLDHRLNFPTKLGVHLIQNLVAPPGWA